MTQELVKTVLEICQALSIISAGVAVIWSVIRKAKLPNQIQNDRINKLEDRMDRVYELLAKDKARMDSFAESERVTQQALLALMNHAINGNDVDKLETAKNRLESYLINK